LYLPIWLPIDEEFLFEEEEEGEEGGEEAQFEGGGARVLCSYSRGNNLFIRV
jgi:hypothetical protein